MEHWLDRFELKLRSRGARIVRRSPDAIEFQNRLFRFSISPDLPGGVTHGAVRVEEHGECDEIDVYYFLQLKRAALLAAVLATISISSLLLVFFSSPFSDFVEFTYSCIIADVIFTMLFIVIPYCVARWLFFPLLLSDLS